MLEPERNRMQESKLKLDVQVYSSMVLYYKIYIVSITNIRRRLAKQMQNFQIINFNLNMTGMIMICMIKKDGKGKFDPSDYKGGPSPFVDKLDYNNSKQSSQNVDFSNQNRMNHSYDGHAEQCFGMPENLNKTSLQRFQGKIENFIQSPYTIKINGSYRYETPAYN